MQYGELFCVKTDVNLHSMRYGKITGIGWMMAAGIGMLLAVGVAYGQPAKYSNAFLTLGAGAKGLSMSNATVALAEGASAAYWNPAGLAATPKKYELDLMHAEYFAGMAKYDYAGLAYRMDDRQTVALSVIRFGVDRIPNTTQLIDKEGNIDYDRITYFTAADWGILLSYGRTFEKVNGLSAGGSLKIIRRRIGDFAGAWGFGLDAGICYEIKKWKIAAAVRDVTSTFNAWSFRLTDEMKDVFLQTGNELPENGLEYTLPSIVFGTGRKFALGKGFALAAEIDFEATFDGKRSDIITSKVFSLAPRTGIELGFKEIVFLRCGVGNIQRETHIRDDQTVHKTTTCQINFGVGIRIKQVVSVDYAFCDLGNLSAAVYSHLFSLKVSLNRFKKQ
jgi:hypothetical protein